MKRRHIRGSQYVTQGPHGRAAKEILQRWMRNGGKRRINRMERREGKREASE